MEEVSATGESSAPDRLTSIGQKAGRGLRWALLGTLATKAGSFAMSLVLVRLLAPHDFGLYAVALAATAFVMHVNDMGVIAATVQWRGRVEDMLATGATVAMLFSLAWYALFWVLAPFVAELAGSTEAAPLVRLLTATIVVDGITAVHVGLIQRTFRQDKLTQAIFAGFLANAAIAIILAVNGAGAYSFVMGQLVQSIVTGFIVLIVSRAPLRYGLDWAIAGRILRFGIPLAVALGIESILLFSDSLVVGHLLGTTVLGYYLLAFNISSWVPGLVGMAVRYVSIPGFSRLAEYDMEDFSVGVRRAVATLFSFVAPVAATLGVLAAPLIEFLYGPEWLPAADALQFLSIVMVARMLISLNFDILTSLGRTRAPVGVNLIWALVLIPSLVLGTQLGGIEGTAIANAIVASVVAIPVAVLSLRRAGVSLRPALGSIVRSLLAAVAGGIVMLAASMLIELPLVLELVIAGGAGWALYGLLVLKPMAWPILIRRVMGRRAAEVSEGPVTSSVDLG